MIKVGEAGGNMKKQVAVLAALVVGICTGCTTVQYAKEDVVRKLDATRPGYWTADMFNPTSPSFIIHWEGGSVCRTW